MRKGYLIILSSLFLLFISFIFIPREFLDFGGDSAQYIILAESLSQGKGFRMPNYPGEPFSFYYPPVFPLLLLPITHFFGRNFYLMHILVTFLGFLSLFLLYGVFKRYAPVKIASLATALFALNSGFIIYSTRHILSDIPYLFFASLTLFWAVGYSEKLSFINKKGFLVLSGLLLSYFTRYSGLTLFLGLIASWLLDANAGRVKIKKIIFLSSSFLIVFALWQIFKSLSPAPGASHIKQLFLIDPYAPYKGTLFEQPSYFLLRFIEGVNYYHSILSDTFFPYLFNKWPLLKDMLSIFVLVIMLLGLWFKFQECKNGIFHYYFLFYFLLIISWPFREGIRLILPILPLIFFYFFSGLQKILNLLPKKIAPFCLLILFSCLLMLNLLTLPIKGYTFQDLPQSLKNFVSLHSWLRENVPQEATVFSRKPTITYFFTNHKSVCYPFTPNPEEIWQEIIKHKVKYIITDEFSQEVYHYLWPFLYQYHERFKLLYHTGDSWLLEVNPPHPLL